MLIRHYRKIFLNGNKCGRTLSFSPQPFSYLKILPFVRSITVTSAVGCDNVPMASKSPPRIYFGQYLLSNPDIYSVVNTNTVNLKERTNFDSLELLKDFISKSEQTEVPEEVVDCFRKEMSNYSLEEIYKFIILMSNVKFDNNSLQLIKHFSDELLRRKFSIEDKLKILFVIKERQPKLLGFKNFNFSYRAVRKLCFKIPKLNPQQAVQVMFAMRPLNDSDVKKFNYPMQQYFAEKIPQLNSDELGIIAYGFNRGKMSILHKDLVFIIINKAVLEIETLRNEHFVVLCKLFASNIHKDDQNALLNFQEKAIPYVPKFNLYAIINLAETGLNIKCMNPLLWNTLASNFKKNINDCGIIYIQRMVHATTLYNIKDDELLSLAIKIFEAENNVLQHSGCLIFFLHDLAIHKLYPENLLGLILSNKFRSETNWGKMSLKRRSAYFCLHCCVELEKPTYNFELLDYKSRKDMFKLQEIFWNSEYRLCSATKNACRVLESRYGESSVFLTNCLPHFQRGIVMRFDKTLKAVSIPGEFKQLEPYYAKKVLKDDLFWVFLRIETEKNFLAHLKTPTLILQTEIRQLEQLGYKPIFILNSDWNEHCRNGSESDFLMGKIMKNLKEVIGEKSE